MQKAGTCSCTRTRRRYGRGKGIFKTLFGGWVPPTNGYSKKSRSHSKKTQKRSRSKKYISPMGSKK